MPPTTDEMKARQHQAIVNRVAVVRELFNDVHLVQAGIVVYRCQAFARRLVSFGFEAYLNEYQPRELLLLATFMPPNQHDTLVREAFARGTPQLQIWIAARHPHLCQKVMTDG